MQRSTSVSVTSRRRAEIYEKLARLAEAGLPAERMLREAAGASPEPLRGCALKAAQLTRGGSELWRAGRISGLFAPLDTTLLRVAEASGSITRVLYGIAEYHRARALRLSSVRAQAMYPLAVLVVAVFLLPLPAFTAGHLDGPGYALRTVVPLAALVLMLGVAGWSYRRLERHGWPDWLMRIELGTPGIGRLTLWRARVEALESLALFLSAGLPAAPALAETLKSINPPRLQARFSAAPRTLARGGSLADALLDGGILDPARGYPLASAAEAAGKLHETIARLARSETAALGESLDGLARWTPRLLYFFVLLLVGAGLLM